MRGQRGKVTIRSGRRALLESTIMPGVRMPPRDESQVPGNARPIGPRPRSPFAGLRDALAEFAYGMTGFEFARHAIATRAAMENLFLAVVIGDMLGLPVMPPYYSLRLLPYVTPEITAWKRRVMRDRQFGDEHDHHLHGV